MQTHHADPHHGPAPAKRPARTRLQVGALSQRQVGGAKGHGQARRCLQLAVRQPLGQLDLRRGAGVEREAAWAART